MITHSQRAPGAAQRASRDVLGEMVALFAHQVRNPLGAIKNAAYLINLTLGAPAPPDVTAALGIIHDEVRRANEILAGFLELTRIGPAQKRPTDIGSLATACLGGADQHPLPAGVMADVDPDQTALAMKHLCHHALLALHSGASLAVELDASSGVVTLTLKDHDFDPDEPDTSHDHDPQDVSMDVLTARVLIDNQGGALALCRRSRRLAIEVTLPQCPTAP